MCARLISVPSAAYPAASRASTTTRDSSWLGGPHMVCDSSWLGGPHVVCDSSWLGGPHMVCDSSWLGGPDGRAEWRRRGRSRVSSAPNTVGSPASSAASAKRTTP